MIEENEGGRVDGEMVERIMFPGESEPARHFALVDGGREKIKDGRVRRGKKIEESKEQGEDSDFFRIGEFHFYSAEVPEVARADLQGDSFRG